MATHEEAYYIRLGWKSAVCPQCQRGVFAGARLADCGVWVMRPHPAAGVCIDTSKLGWDSEYKFGVHEMCPGSGQEPECTYDHHQAGTITQETEGKSNG